MPVADVAVAVENVVAASESLAVVKMGAYDAWVVVGRLVAVVGDIVMEVAANVPAGIVEVGIVVDVVFAPLELW